MKLQFKPSYGNIRTFFHNVTDMIELVSVGRKDDPILEDIICDIAHIVFIHTGMSIVNKEKDNKSIIEVNNFRALDVMLFIASESHELNDNQVLSGDTSYREIYQKEIRDRLEQMAISDALSVVHSWLYEGDTMYDYISFSIDSIILEKCMHEIHDYIKNM